ncbi:MAG: polymer-forming cytoskeletal protein [Magnetococcales bacterium]|nr:polymer-forming cytoskeletal protein [Magnetococcales bacterium]
MFFSNKNKDIQSRIDRSDSTSFAADSGSQPHTPLFEPGAGDASDATVIAPGTRVKGEINIRGRLQVDGDFEGQIISEGLVIVGKTGRVEGKINARKLVAQGHFHGQAECEEIEILAGGNVTGQIHSTVMVIERGSFFEGESRLRESPPNPAAASWTPLQNTTTTEVPAKSVEDDLALDAPPAPPPPSRRETVYSNTDLLNDAKPATPTNKKK